MKKEVTNNEILESIDTLTVSVSALTEVTNKNSQSIDTIASSLNTLGEITTKNTESIDLIAKTTVYILENMATKHNLFEIEFNLQTQINDLSIDLKGFKHETRENFKEVNEKLDDLLDTSINHDRRIEKLETAVFA